MQSLHPKSEKNIEFAAQFQIRRLPDGHYYVAACRLTQTTINAADKAACAAPGSHRWTDDDLWQPIAYETGELVTFSEPATARAWIERQSRAIDNRAPIEART